MAQGWGGQLILIKGGQIDIVNRSLEATADAGVTDYVGIANNTQIDNDDFNKSMFGGESSWFPSAYSNHKPAAFDSRGQLIQSLNRIGDEVSDLYIGGWDGSGLFFNGGGQFESRLWKSGRGWNALSPSGSHGMTTRDLAVVRHNDVVFGIGYHLDGDPAPGGSQWDDFGWTVDFNVGDMDQTEVRRTYRVWSVDGNDKRILGPVTRFTPNAISKEHLNACDAFSHKNDVYYANWVDILRFPGGSGIPEVMHFNRGTPLTRSFAAWPSGGFSPQLSPSGENRLLVLDGDGKLYRMKAPASGRDQLVDLTSLVGNEDGRPNDNFFARLNSSVNEPGRTSLLLPLENNLHAFVVTATSGYMHFTCVGDPSGTTNWTNRTTEMPTDLRSKDGNVYGFVDHKRDKIYLLHSTYSKFGLYGAAGGGQNAGGGFWLYEHDVNRTWKELNRSIVGMPIRGLVPYSNLGPWARTPSGTNPEVMKCSDYTVLTYELYDQLARSVDVEVEYSLTNGASWFPARRFKSYDTQQLLGSGTEDLPTSPNGIEYTFFWNHVHDVGFDTKKEALLRVRPLVSR